MATPALYLDIFSGISGDMFLGALIDLGVPIAELERHLGKLGVNGYHLHVSSGQKAGIAGVKVDVHLDHDADHHHHDHSHDGGGHDHSHDHGHHPKHGHDHGHGHDHHDEHEHAHGRNYADIRRLIEGSGLDAWVRQRAIAVFHRIAIAEGKVHGRPPEDVHFHEVGAIDSIVDIVGACIALDLLGRPAVYAGAVVEGTGFVKCAHGRMPLPAPATLEIFAARGVGVTQCEEPNELVTPTGAALLAEFAVAFGPLQGFVARRIGYGLGTRENLTRPNLLRAALGEIAVTSSTAAGGASAHDWETDTVAVLETNLDDVSSEVLGHFVGKALEAGALDVFHTPIQMKKNRPGVLLTVLCPEAEADRFAAMVLTETTAFGVRQTAASRRKLRRELVAVTTEFGDVTVKLGRLDGRIVQSAPEYESCRSRAEAAGVALKVVYEAALRAAAGTR